MSAQTLETIPEETPTQVPAPTTTPGRVTSDVPKTKPATEKNPGRVASGKRLAERNRMAREAKKKAEAGNPTPTPAATQSSDAATSNSNNSIYLILGVGGLIVSAAGVYYQREAIMKTLKPAPVEENKPSQPPAKSAIPVPQRNRLRKME